MLCDPPGLSPVHLHASWCICHIPTHSPHHSFYLTIGNVLLIPVPFVVIASTALVVHTLHIARHALTSTFDYDIRLRRSATATSIPSFHHSFTGSTYLSLIIAHLRYLLPWYIHTTLTPVGSFNLHPIPPPFHLSGLSLVCALELSIGIYDGCTISDSRCFLGPSLLHYQVSTITTTRS